LEKKKNWPKKWGGHGRPSRCGSVALDMYRIDLSLEGTNLLKRLRETKGNRGFPRALK